MDRRILKPVDKAYLKFEFLKIKDGGRLSWPLGFLWITSTDEILNLFIHSPRRPTHVILKVNRLYLSNG